MSTLEKAKVQLESCGASVKIENKTLYVFVDDLQLELAEFEINFRAGLWNEENQKDEK